MKHREPAGLRIGYVMRRYRMLLELTLRDMAQEIGVSAPTLMRLEIGHAPDNVTMLKLINWLFGPILPRRPRKAHK